MSRKPTKSAGRVREWRITLVRAKGQYIGRVEAPDAETAIKEPIPNIRHFRGPAVMILHLTPAWVARIVPPPWLAVFHRFAR